MTVNHTIHHILRTLRTAVLLGLVLPSVTLAAGLLKPLNAGDKDLVAIRSHTVDVLINNGFSRTTVDQVFFNSGTSDLEAVYSFPVPKQASLSELSLWIGGKEVLGEVLPKEKAKQVYQDQKAKGNDTALAEKNDVKTFDVRVWPVKARGETRVRLVYYQPVEIDLNVGRYVYPLEEGGVDDERISFWSVDSRVKETFSFNLTLKSAFPVKDVRLPQYESQAKIDKTGGNNGQVVTAKLDSREGGSLDKDIVFYYRLDDTVPARVEIVPYRDGAKGDGTFMAVVTPGASLKPLHKGSDWTFILDVSGSMQGDKIGSLVSGVNKVIGNMAPADRFRIVTFNDRAEDFTGGYVQATPDKVREVLGKINAISASGGTDLFSGLAKAYQGLDSDRTTGIVLVTDGVANLGTTKHAALVNLIRNNDYRLFAFIIGNSANQPLLDSLAKESGGFSMNISSRDDIAGRLIQAKAKVFHECIANASLKFQGGAVKDLTPSSVGKLYMGQQLVVFGRYGRPGEVRLEFSGRVGNEEKTWTCTAVLPEKETANPEIERLWALSAIDGVMEKIRMDGESNSLLNRIVDLGTEYSLVTDYTSMVVVNDNDRESMGLSNDNADRVARERVAAKDRDSRAPSSTRADKGSDGGMFKGVSAPSVGSGPVGPFFLMMAWFLKRRAGKK